MWIFAIERNEHWTLNEMYTCGQTIHTIHKNTHMHIYRKHLFASLNCVIVIRFGLRYWRVTIHYPMSISTALFPIYILFMIDPKLFLVFQLLARGCYLNCRQTKWLFDFLEFLKMKLFLKFSTPIWITVKHLAIFTGKMSHCEFIETINTLAVVWMKF